LTAVARFINLIDRLAGLGRRHGPPGGVVVVSSGSLGDTVLFALVAARFQALAENGEEVRVVLRHDAAAMAFLFPPEVTVDVIDHRRLRRHPAYRLSTLRRLGRANARLVVSADYLRHPDLDEALIRACRGAETVAMKARPWAKYDGALKRNRVLFDRLFDSGPPVLDKVVRWAAFADWLTRRPEPPPMVRLPTDRLAPAAVLDRPTVLIQPFSAVTLKQSPPALYQRVIRALPGDWRVRITGAPGDMERNPSFAGLLDPPRVTFDASTFEALVPMLRAARLVISVDTALLHLAVAVGAPTLGLASAAFVGEIVPYASDITPSNAHILYHSMPCEGCLGACVLPARDGMYPCVAELDADGVIAKVEELVIKGAGG
jgi:ADP-heptose:LPS heptosyltransferase